MGNRIYNQCMLEEYNNYMKRCNQIIYLSKCNSECNVKYINECKVEKFIEDMLIEKINIYLTSSKILYKNKEYITYVIEYLTKYEEEMLKKTDSILFNLNKLPLLEIKNDNPRRTEDMDYKYYWIVDLDKIFSI